VSFFTGSCAFQHFLLINKQAGRYNAVIREDLANLSVLLDSNTRLKLRLLPRLDWIGAAQEVEIAAERRLKHVLQEHLPIAALE